MFSYTASAVVSALTEFLVAAMSFALTLKYVGYIPSVRFLPHILLSGGAMAVFLYFFQALRPQVFQTLDRFLKFS